MNPPEKHMKRSLLTVITIFSIVSAVVAKAEQCCICRKDITGKFFIYKLHDGDCPVCLDCKENLGACVRCGLPVPGTSKSQTDILCSSCRLSAEKCQVCGDVIIGMYYTNEANRIFCSKCFESAARCEICDTILLPGEWSYSDNQKICHHCLKTTPRCVGCNQLIKGQYSVYSGFEGVCCDRCQNETPACLSCLRPCGPSPVKLDNGQVICRDCSKTAILDRSNFHSIIVEVSKDIERNLLMTVVSDIEFKLADRFDTSREAEGYRELGQFIRTGNDFSIEILKGLSRPICLETVAHELAHAWQYENHPHLKDQELVEGFAQWVAGKVLEHKGYSDLIVRLHLRDDVYGRGYRRLKEWERLYGISGVFQQLKKHGSLGR